MTINTMIMFIELIQEAFSFAFFQRSLLVGLVLAIVYALMGNFVVLRKEAVIGHTIANLSFLGVAVGLLAQWHIPTATIVAAILGSLLLLFGRQVYGVASDSLLVALAQLAMAGALVVISLLEGYQPDLLQYLFGSILAVSWQDAILAGGLFILVLGYYLWQRQRLLQIAIEPALARAQKRKVIWIDLGYFLILAIVIGFGMKLIGVILLEALLILPANIAKLWAKSFKQMVVIGVIISLIAMIGGLFSSYVYDVPSGAAIVLLLGIMFGVSLVLQKVRH